MRPKGEKRLAFWGLEKNDLKCMVTETKKTENQKQAATLERPKSSRKLKNITNYKQRGLFGRLYKKLILWA